MSAGDADVMNNDVRTRLKTVNYNVMNKMTRTRLKMVNLTCRRHRLIQTINRWSQLSPHLTMRQPVMRLHPSQFEELKFGIKNGIWDLQVVFNEFFGIVIPCMKEKDWKMDSMVILIKLVHSVSSFCFHHFSLNISIMINSFVLNLCSSSYMKNDQIICFERPYLPRQVSIHNTR